MGGARGRGGAGKGKGEEQGEEEGGAGRRIGRAGEQEEERGEEKSISIMHNCGKEENHVTDFRFLTPADLFFEQKP